MNEICRLCLTVSVEMACETFEESNLLQNLSNINIKLTVNKFLPYQVCQLCFKMLEDFSAFRENIIQNENKLIQLLNNGLDVKDAIFKNKTIHIKNEPYIENNRFEDTIYSELVDENIKKKLISKYKRKAGNHIKIGKVVGEIELKRKNEDNKYNKHEKDCKKDEIEDIDKIKTGDVCIKSKDVLEEISYCDKLISQKANHHDQNDTNIPRELETKVEKQVNNTIIMSNINLNTKRENETLNNTNLNTIELDKDTNIPETKENITKVTPHKCLTCLQNLLSHLELIEHYKRVHNKPNSSDSSKSGYTFQETEENPYKCNDCGESFKCKDDVEVHLLSHKSDRPYMCKLCGRTFKCVYDIVRHRRVHSDTTLYCSHGCGYHTVYKGALKDHEKRHEKDFRYKCATCGVGFHAKTWHDQHQNIHNNVKPFVCDVCGMAFHMHRYLTSHRTMVHPEVSRGVKRYICTHCGHACYNKHSLKLHLEEHEIKTSFLCDICGKVCSTKEQLKYHKNSHLGLKPYSCNICSKKFAKKFNLSIHEKAHSGEKHLCQICGKYFAQRSTLLRHSRRRHPDKTDNIKSTETIKVDISNY